MSAAFSLSRGIARAIILCFCLVIAASPLAAEAKYHVVAKGETLYSVAISYGVNPVALAAANSISDPERLHVGTKLRIPSLAKDPAASSAPPAKAQHKVVKGDTLYSIARSYGVTVDELRAANKLKSSSIKPGDILELPAAAHEDKPIVSGPSKVPSPDPAMPEAVKITEKPVDKGLVWPCPGNILYMDGKIYGVVIKSKLGEAVKAVASGTVTTAGPFRGWGNVAFVTSRTGHIYVYGGNDDLLVRVGDKVVAGQELGKVGMDLKLGGPTAYFCVFKDEEALDPAKAPRG